MIAPSAPIPEASVGVAQPARIEPSVAVIRPISGRTPTTTSLSITGSEWTRSSFGTGGPSFGLMKLRTIR